MEQITALNEMTPFAEMGVQGGGPLGPGIVAYVAFSTPDVVLEPVWQTEDLAPVLVEALTAMLLRLREEGGLAIVLVEQNSRVALSFSARTVVRDQGRIVYDGESAAPSADPERLAELIGVAE